MCLTAILGVNCYCANDDLYPSSIDDKTLDSFNTDILRSRGVTSEKMDEGGIFNLPFSNDGTVRHIKIVEKSGAFPLEAEAIAQLKEKIDSFLTERRTPETTGQIILPIGDLHGGISFSGGKEEFGKSYPIIRGIIKYLKEKGFQKDQIIFLLNGDLAGRAIGQTDVLDKVYRDLIFPLKDDCQIIVGLGNHDVQDYEGEISLLLKGHSYSLHAFIRNLKENSIPFITNLPKEAFRPEALEGIEDNLYGYKIYGNTLIFPYITSGLQMGGGDAGGGCDETKKLLTDDFFEYFDSLFKDPDRKGTPDQFKCGEKPNPIIVHTAMNLVNALNELAGKNKTSPTLVIAAHENWIKTKRVIEYCLTLQGKDIDGVVIPTVVPGILENLRIYCACGHDHKPYNLESTIKIPGIVEKPCIVFAEGWFGQWCDLVWIPKAEQEVEVAPLVVEAHEEATTPKWVLPSIVGIGIGGIVTLLGLVAFLRPNREHV
ncbi:MAG: metallophosphoesterase [Holosporales bacterium]|jgi:predicted MPP superfamily phosphohydrolase|nr:metallophosphoesterase [Holosporales bacterium]